MDIHPPIHTLAPRAPPFPSPAPPLPSPAPPSLSLTTDTFSSISNKGSPALALEAAGSVDATSVPVAVMQAEVTLINVWERGGREGKRGRE